MMQRRGCVVHTILVLIADERDRARLAGELRKQGLHVLACASPAEAQALLASLSAQLLLAPPETAADLTRLLGVPVLPLEPGLDAPALARRIESRLARRPA